VRYGINQNGWNPYFIPTWAYVTGYSFENHWFGFKVNSPTFSTSEEELNVKVYPNPADDILNIDMDGSLNIHVQVSNTIGQILKSETLMGSGRIDISSLPSGLYLVNVEAENGMKYTRKITVK
jgi:hypothetical protein